MIFFIKGKVFLIFARVAFSIVCRLPNQKEQEHVSIALPEMPEFGKWENVWGVLC
jgi:hypothetical protein